MELRIPNIAVKLSGRFLGFYSDFLRRAEARTGMFLLDVFDL